MEHPWRYFIVLWYHSAHSKIDYRNIIAWAALVHTSIGTAPLVLRVCNFFWLFVQIRPPFQYLDINFDATFTTSSQDIMFYKYVQINSLYCPICEKRKFWEVASLFWTSLYMLLYKHFNTKNYLCSIARRTL